MIKALLQDHLVELQVSDDFLQALVFFLERGVKPQFAIQTLRAGSDGMWYPRRKELLEGGILTE